MSDKEGHMGWGHESYSADKKLYIEQIEQDINIQLFGEEKFSEPLHEEGEENEFIVKRLKERDWADDGWDMCWAEDIVYKKRQWRGPQNMGNCVGASHCIGLAQRVAHEILIQGDPEIVLGDSTNSPIPFIPYSYGAGRCLSGNMCGRFDGSYCSVQLRASEEHGFLPSDTEGLPGTGRPQPSSSIGRSWGRNQGNVLQKWRDKALKFDLEFTYKVTSEQAMWDALVRDFMPVQICSNWGFRKRKTVQIDGGESFSLYGRGGSWAHSMTVEAAKQFKGDRFYRVSNQWGNNAHADGYYFYVDSDTMKSWIRNADARTIGEIKGRPFKLDFPVV